MQTTTFAGSITYCAGEPETDLYARDDAMGSAFARRVIVAGRGWLGNTPIHEVAEGAQHLEAKLDHNWRGALQCLIGDYCIAYVTPRRDTYVIYRSVTSPSPIYYRDSGGRIEWSLDIGGLFQVGKPTIADVDCDFLPLLSLGAGLPPTRTVYRNVHKLAAGFALVIDRQGVKVVAVDRLTAETDLRRLTLTDAADGLRSLIKEAVTRAVAGHDRVAVLLSGGIDSSIVAVEAADAATSLTAYHMSLPRLRSLDDERERAEEAATSFGAQIVPVDMSTHLTNGGDGAKCFYGRHYPPLNCFPRFPDLVAEHISDEGATLVLDGEFGDVLLPVPEDASRLYGRNPGRRIRGPLTLATDILDVLGCANMKMKLAFDTHLARPSSAADDPMIRRFRSLLTTDASRGFAELFSADSNDPEEFASQAFAVLADHFSERVNRTWHPYGIEDAHPLGDRRLLEFCLGLAPWHRNRVYAGQMIDKVALRAAYLDRLPPSIVRGYDQRVYLAVHETYVRENKLFLAELLGDNALLAEMGVIDTSAVLDSIRTAAHMTLNSIVSAANTEIWLRGLAGHPLPDDAVAASMKAGAHDKN